MKLASRIGLVQPSPTLAISARAKELAAAGEDVISFGAGEPDFNTPELICDAAKAALDAGYTRYTAAAGIEALREAVAKDYGRRGREVLASNVVISVGGKQALYSAMQVLFEEGDKVLVPSPYWVSYPAQILLAGATPVVVECVAKTGFKLDPSQLEEALKDGGVKGLVLCSPSNPTGGVYTVAQLRALGEVLKRHPEVVVLFDAMYDRLYYDGEIAPDFVASCPELEEQVVTFNGFSKTFAMTGWRLGWAIGPEKAIKAMSKLQSQSTSNATTFVQHAGIAALKMDEMVVEEMRDVFRERRDLIVGLLRGVPQVECLEPEGAFYAFPDFSAYLGDRFADDLELASYLLDQAKVAVVPGSAFGAPGFVRLSYATSDALIEEGVERIKKALA